MSAPRAIAGGIYYLSGVLVKAETKEVAKKLIAKGFRTATEGIKNSGLKVQTVTNSNFVTFVTRALKKAIEQNKKIRQGPKIDPKTGRPAGSNKLGGSGHSAIGRKLGSRKMKNFGDVRGGKPRSEAMAKSRPASLNLTNAQRVYKPSAKSSEVAGNKSNFTPTIVVTSPLSSSAEEASSKIPSVQTKAKKTSTQVQRKARADAAAKRKAALKKPAKEGSLVGDAGTKSEKQKLAAAKADAVKRNTTARKKAIERAVAEANKPTRPKLRPKTKDISLRTYLNQEIKKKKSTVAKEKAKAKKGGYTSIASAKKAKSLYYMKDGKPMAAVYKEELKGK